MEQYKSKELEHLGLVSAMYEELAIGEKIDELIEQDKEKRILSIGQAVKAMVLNGLGFVNKSLYLTPMYFKTKPTERLIGEGIEPHHINDDTLGRALDKLYTYGVSSIFSLISKQAIERLGIDSKNNHLDSTSFHVDGRYNSEGEIEEGVIHITKGYSRDHRADLNQVVLELIVENKAGIPKYIKPMDGNSSDKKAFMQVIKEYINQWKEGEVGYLVADSAMYSQQNIKELAEKGVKWISRVPESIKEAKQVIEATKTMEDIGDGYSFLEYNSSYGGVSQRWVVYYSEEARKRAEKSIKKILERETSKEYKEFKKLCNIEFACEEDAHKAVKRLQFKLSNIESYKLISQARYKRRGRPSNEPPGYIYKIEGAIGVRLDKKERLLFEKSCFIITTNEVDRKKLSAKELLHAYKNQHIVERGFRFLKDPMFLASSLFLKNPKRIMALTMVMAICLLVYAAIEHKIRLCLKENNKFFHDQKGKPTQRPTTRWVFQCFGGIHLLLINLSRQIVLNLEEHHMLILSLLGDDYVKVYS